MATTPEGKVKSQVKKWLKAHNVWFYMPVAGPFAVHGIPDFVCCWDGDFIGIETKAEGKIKNTTPHQDRVIKEINEHGGIAIVVDSIERLESELGRRGRYSK